MFVETLPVDVQRLLERLGRLPTVEPFYLAGGSAVALHLGHRVSADLDFFTPQDDYEAEPLIQELQSVGHLAIRQQKRGTQGQQSTKTARLLSRTTPHPQRLVPLPAVPCPPARTRGPGRRAVGCPCRVEICVPRRRR